MPAMWEAAKLWEAAMRAMREAAMPAMRPGIH
jgi:hypothetical protein